MSLEKDRAKPEAKSAANRAEPLKKTAARNGAFARPGPSPVTAANMANSSLSHSHAAAPGAALAAGAAAMADAAHVEAAAAHNARWLPWLTKEIAALGIGVTPSVGNFLLLRFPGTTGKTSADADRYLNARGFVLRAVEAYGLPDCLRLTVGVEEANRGVVAALAAFMAGGQS